MVDKTNRERLEMKWCVACKCEFEDYVEKCTDCGAQLVVDDIYHAQMNAHKSDRFTKAPTLTAVYESTLDSEIIHVVELLKDHGIISEIKNEGVGSYLQIYGGVNYLGTSVCVSEKDAEAAKVIVDEYWGEQGKENQMNKDSKPINIDEPEMESYRMKYNKSLRLKRNFLKVFLLLLFGVGVVYQVLSIISFL